MGLVISKASGTASTSVRILFVGEQNEPSRAWQRARALERLGHIVFRVNTRAKGISALDRVLWKARLVRDAVGANEAAVAAASHFQPDLVWVDKGNSIRRSTLLEIKTLCPDALLISFAEDDMYARHNRSLSYAKALSAYDLVITTKSYNCDPTELPSLGAKRVLFWDNTYDEILHRPVQVDQWDLSRFAAQVGFIGTFEPNRAESLVRLARSGIPVRVRGNGGWERLKGLHPNLDAVNEEVVGEDYVKSLCSTKVNLCFLRKINRDQQTARSVEIPACGAFMLAEKTKEHSALFREDLEAVYFSSDDELLEKTRYFLKNCDQRKKIAQNGRARCELSGYSVQAKMMKLMASLELT